MSIRRTIRANSGRINRSCTGPACPSRTGRLSSTGWPGGSTADAGSSGGRVRRVLVGDRPERARHRPAVLRSAACSRRCADDLVAAATTGFGATDVLRFLDRKPHPALAGEVTIDRKTRPDGCRVKFRLKANAIKFYDHQNVLRIETTINNPREFKVLRAIDLSLHPRKRVARNTSAGARWASRWSISGAMPRWPVPPTGV